MVLPKALCRWLQKLSCPLVHNCSLTQNKAELPKMAARRTLPQMQQFIWTYLSLKSRVSCICHFLSNQRPEGQLISGQQYIYAQAQYRAQVDSLKPPEASGLSVCTRLANLEMQGWRRPWLGAFPVTRVTYIAKPAENIRKHCTRSSLLRLLERKIPCHFHPQHHFKTISYSKGSQIISKLYALQSLQPPLNYSLGAGRKPQCAKHNSGGGKTMARKFVVNLSFMLFGNQSPKYPV